MFRVRVGFERKFIVAAFLSMLAGKKTYLVAIAMAVLGVVELFTGEVPLGLQTLLGAMTAVGLRGAITQSKL